MDIKEHGDFKIIEIRMWQANWRRNLTQVEIIESFLP